MLARGGSAIWALAHWHKLSFVVNQNKASIVVTWILLLSIGSYPLCLFLTADGKCINVTGLQLPGVLDDLFSYNGPLGALYSEESVSLYLWAPTAQVYHIF